MLTEQIAVTMIVTGALDALGVPYAIGGSFASTLHGVMRATMDEMTHRPQTVQELLSRFRGFVDQQTEGRIPTKCGL